MPSLTYGPQQVVLQFPTNEALADIQSLSHSRFSAGLGFFMTMYNGGTEVTDAFWMHPSIPLVFHYDVRDVTGEYLPTLEVDQEKQSRMLRQIEEPLGIISGFEPGGGPRLPFAPPPTAAS
jgi:hypothetical protein